MAPPWPMMRFGKLEGGGTLSSSEQQKLDITFEDYKNLQKLLDITDGFTSLPNASMREEFDKALKQAEDDISGIFFNGHSQDCTFGGTGYSSIRNKVASCLMVKSISKVNEHNFSKAVNGNEAEAKWHDVVHGEDGREMGNSLLTQNLIDNHGFQFYLDDKAKWLTMLESLFQDEVYIIGTIVKQLSMNVNLPGKMKFFILQVFGSSKIDVIADKWIACSSVNIVQPCLDFIRTDNHMDFISAWLDDDPYYYDVSNACNEDETEYYQDWLIHDYGEKVIKWLKNGSIGPKQHGLSINADVIQPIEEEHIGGCFLAGTVVANEEGNDVCIEDLQENDLILGQAGNVGVISSEKAGVILTYDTPAYGFNDDEPFFLSSHPFWSQDGWRAVNPAVASDENTWLDIGPLHVGDYVCKVKSINGHNIEYEWVKIERFRIKTYPAGTRFYGIHTREGPRSYHANNYLVMQNYPEITIQSVADRMTQLDKKTLQSVEKDLKRIKPTLKNLLGEAAGEAVSSLAKKRVLKQLTKPSKPSSKNPFLSKNFTVPTLALKYKTNNVSYASYMMPASILIHRRQLYVDKKFVKEMFISSDKEVTWCRRVEDGLWEHGCMKLYDNNLAGSGFIALTKAKYDEDALLFVEVKAHYKAVVFNCDKSNEEIDPPEVDGKTRKARLLRSSLTWHKCGSFEVEVKCDPTLHVWAGVAIGNVTKRSDLGGCVKHGVDQGQSFIVDINVLPKYYKFTKHTKICGTFNPLFSSFNGYCTEYDPEAPGFCGKTYAWRGRCDTWGAYDKDELEMARRELLKSKLHNKARIGLCTNFATGELEESQLHVASKMTPLLREKVKSSLSVDDLFLLTPPDSTELHDRTTALMEKCMKFEMSDEDRAAVLGESKPILSGEEEAVAEAHKEFIGTRFAHCYLMNALSNLDSFKDMIADKQRSKLLYFFAGDDKDGCMSPDQEYRAANNDLARQAFIGLCPRIKDYIADDGPGWAQKLYDYITTPDKLAKFSMLSQDNDCRNIQKQAMVLYCLDPDRDLGCEFYNILMMAKLQSNFDYFNGSDEVADGMVEIIGGILEVLVDKIRSGDDKELVGNIMQQCQEELQELQGELVQYGKDMMATMIDFVTQVVRKGGFTGDFWDRYFAAGKEILDAMQPHIVGKALKWICGMVLPGIAFFFTIQAFTNFDALAAKQKASVILDASSAALSMINKGGPALIEKFKKCFTAGEGDFKFATMYYDAERSGVTLSRLLELTESAGSAVAGKPVTLEQAIANTMDGAERDISVIESRWTKAFKNGRNLAKVTGIMASFIGANGTGLKIFRDVEEGKQPGIEAFKAIETGASAMVGLCEAFSLTIECQALPIVGQLCGIIGLVVAIVSQPIHDPPYHGTLAKVYCEKRGGPYIDTLKDPTQSWLDHRHKQHPDDPDQPES